MRALMAAISPASTQMLQRSGSHDYGGLERLANLQIRAGS
jgi:hypothetical protein